MTLDTASQGTISGAVATLTFSHTVASGRDLLLVAIAWQEPSTTDTLDSVAWNGTSMTHLGSAGYVDLYALANPETGTHNVVATWSGSNTKAAVGEAIGVTSKSEVGLPRLTNKLQATSTSATASHAGSMPRSVIMGALGVSTVPGTTTVTPNAGVTSLWSASAGTTMNLDRTQAEGGSVPVEGDPVGIGWSLSASRSWGLLTTEILPWLTLATDVEVADCPTAQFGILATAYSSLQAAIDALPANGGVIYVPSGIYRLTSGLTIDKPNVTLIGEGFSTVITSADPENLPLDLLTIRAQFVRLYNLSFEGRESAIDLENGHYGIACIGQDATEPTRIIRHCYFENVLVTGTSRCALWLVDTILLTAVNCAFNLNKGDGVRIQGGEEGGSNTTLRFIGCEMGGNGGIGLNIGDEDPGFSGQVGLTFLGCTFEGNEGASLGDDISLVGVGVNAYNSFKLEFTSCYFEVPGEAMQYMRFYLCPNVTVDNCVFFGNVADFEEGPDFAVTFLGCALSRLTSNTMQGFATAIVDFDSSCTDCVEFCNRDLDTEVNVPRIQMDGRGVIGMSRSGVGLRAIFSEGQLPDAKEEGTLVWVSSPTGAHSKLQIWDGAAWKSIALT